MPSKRNFVRELEYDESVIFRDTNKFRDVAENQALRWQMLQHEHRKDEVEGLVCKRKDEGVAGNKVTAGLVTVEVPR